jgi:hypothetical protein
MNDDTSRERLYRSIFAAASDELNKEVDGGYQTLGLLDCAATLRLIDNLLALPSSTQHDICFARLRRYYATLCPSSVLPVSGDERVLESFARFSFSPARPILISDTRRPLLNKRSLAEAARHLLSTLYGRPPLVRRPGTQLVATSTIGAYDVSLVLSIGADCGQIEYHYEIFERSRSEPSNDSHSTSMLDLGFNYTRTLGFHSTTFWDGITYESFDRFSASLRSMHSCIVRILGATSR